MDDLTRIKGIGPAAAKRLAQAGIETFAQLAAIEDGEDGRAEQLGVRPAWIAEAARMVAQAATQVAEQQDTLGKPPRPDHGAEGSAEAPALPADSGAGDPQQDNPQNEARGGGDGNPAVPSREDALAMAALPAGLIAADQAVDAAFVEAIHAMRGPHELADTVQESMGVGDAPIAGVPDAPIGEASPAILSEADIDKLGRLGAGEVFQAAILQAHPRVKAAQAAWIAANPDRWPSAIVVVSSADGFRRGGQAHPKGETRYLPGAFDIVQLEQLLGEPKLKVTFE